MDLVIIDGLEYTGWPKSHAPQSHAPMLIKKVIVILRAAHHYKIYFYTLLCSQWHVWNKK